TPASAAPSGASVSAAARASTSAAAVARAGAGTLSAWRAVSSAASAARARPAASCSACSAGSPPSWRACGGGCVLALSRDVVAGGRGVFGAAAHRAGRAVVQMAGEDGGLGLAPVGVERAEGGAGFICGALRGIAGLAGLRLGGLALGELLARRGQCGERVGT